MRCAIYPQTGGLRKLLGNPKLLAFLGPETFLSFELLPYPTTPKGDRSSFLGMPSGSPGSKSTAKLDEEKPSRNEPKIQKTNDLQKSTQKKLKNHQKKRPKNTKKKRISQHTKKKNEKPPILCTAISLAFHCRTKTTRRGRSRRGKHSQTSTGLPEERRTKKGFAFDGFSNGLGFFNRDFLSVLYGFFSLMVF